jgi:hypothetical protein
LRAAVGVDAAVRADIIARVQAMTNAALINARGAITGEIGFDVFGDTINPVLTIYRVEDGHWIAIRQHVSGKALG